MVARKELEAFQAKVTLEDFFGSEAKNDQDKKDLKH
jgi:hypothetical protein